MLNDCRKTLISLTNLDVLEESTLVLSTGFSFLNILVTKINQIPNGCENEIPFFAQNTFSSSCDFERKLNSFSTHPTFTSTDFFKIKSEKNVSSSTGFKVRKINREIIENISDVYEIFSYFQHKKGKIQTSPHISKISSNLLNANNKDGILNLFARKKLDFFLVKGNSLFYFSFLTSSMNINYFTGLYLLPLYRVFSTHKLLCHKRIFEIRFLFFCFPFSDNEIKQI